MKKHLLQSLLFIGLFTGSFGALQAAIWYVKPAASGTGDGSSWANASGNLQAMINASAGGDEVWVASGTYKPTTGTDRAISFVMKDGVAIYGGFNGTETSLAQRPNVNPVNGNASGSILSGDLLGNDVVTGSSSAVSITNHQENSYHVIKNSNLTNTAVLDGFVIARGNANEGNDNRGGGIYNIGEFGGNSGPQIVNCLFQYNSASFQGGAIHNNGAFNGNSSPVLKNCSFQYNTASSQGGAILNLGSFNGISSPALTNCSFQNNSASYDGGAIHNLGNDGACNPTLTDCSFQFNSATNAGGAIGNYYSSPVLNNCSFLNNSASYRGGAMDNVYSRPSINRGVFKNNTASNQGGAMGNFSSGTTLANCAFLSNSAPRAGAILSTNNNNLVLTNCTFLNNVATNGDGGAMYNYETKPALTNCTFTGNMAQRGTVLFNVENSNPTLTNCVLFGNGGSATIFDFRGVTTAAYSLFENGITGFAANGNNITGVTTSPFKSANSTELSPCSPAINAGSNAAYTAANGPATDLASELRFFNNGTIDMGAYEYQQSVAPVFDKATFTLPSTNLLVNTTYLLNITNILDQCAHPYAPASVSIITTGPRNNIYSLPSGQFDYTFNSVFVYPGNYTLKVLIDNVEAFSKEVTVNYIPQFASGNFEVSPLTVVTGQPVTVSANNFKDQFNAPFVPFIAELKYLRDNVLVFSKTFGSQPSYTDNQAFTEPGSYQVQIYIDNLQVNSANVTVTTANINTTITASGPTQFCRGSSVTLTAPEGYTYAWTNGATSQSITVTESGNYSVVVSDAFGNMATSSIIDVEVIDVSQPQIIPLDPTQICQGTVVRLVSTASTGNQWYKNGEAINGATDALYSAMEAGSYYVVSTNLICTSQPSNTIQIGVNPVPDVSVSPQMQTILSGSAMAAIVPSGSVTGTVFNWTRNNTGNVTGIATSGSGTISGSLTNTTLSAQTVTFTITPLYSNAGTTCIGKLVTASVQVAAPLPIVKCKPATIYLNAMGQATLLPVNVDDGSKDALGGAVTLSLLQNNSEVNSINFSCAQVGPQNVTLLARDASGNTATCVAIVTVIDQLSPTLTGALPGGDVGSVCKANAPSAPSTASIADRYTDNCGAVTATYDPALSGVTGTDCQWTATYVYHITDKNNNTTADAVVTYTGGDKTAPALTGTLPGGDVGSVCKANAPAAPSTASIAALYTDNCGTVSAELLTSNITGTDCGWTATYTYQIKDACGNTANNAVITYTGADKTAPALTGTLPGGDVGSVCKASAPAAPSTASIAALYTDNCAAVSAELLTSNITGTDCGWTATYTYQIKDACGNTANNAVITYTGADKTAPALTGTLPGGDVGSVCKASAPSAPSAASIAALYIDNCGAVSAELLTSQVTGTNQQWTATYTYAITDACGNAASNAVVTYTGGDNEAPTITILPNINLKACEATATWQAPTAADNCAGVTVTQTAGLAPGSVIANGTTVTVEYTAEDAGGLKTKTSFTITRDAELKGNATSTPILCFSGQSQVTIAATGGRAPYSYSNGTETNTTGSFMQPAGTTTYTVTDAAGCIYSFDNNLTQPSAIVVNAAVTSNYNGAQVSCFGRADGQITLTSIGGTGTLSYSLDGVSTNNTGVFSNLAAAVYTYRVTDANGCVKSAPIELTQPAKLEVTETHTDIGCLIGGISNVTIKATGGTQPYSFTQQGQGGSTNSTGLFTQLPITQYSYQVADKNGCSAALQLAIQPNDFTAPSFTRPADITIAPAQGSNCYNALPSVTGNVTNANDDKTLASSLLVTYTDVVSNCGYSTIIKRTWHVEDGCRNAAPEEVQTITVTDNKTPYIVLATKEAKFGRGNIINGSVGVSAADGKASFDRDSKLLSPEFVKAASITKDATANINTQYTMPATDGPNPVFYPFAGITKGLGNYTVSTSTTVPINANYEKLTIKKGVTVTIGGTLYGDINIEDGAQVTFAPAGGIINIEELKIKDAKEDAKMGDAGDRPNRILFSQCTSVRIKNKVEIGKNTKFNVDGPRVTIYLGDDKTDEEKFTVSGGNTEVQANIYLKNGKLKVNGNDNQFNFNTVMTGWYIVEKLESTGKNVQWNRNACNTTSTRSTEAGPGIVRQPAQNDYFAVKALPNPSTTNFRLLVQSYSSEPVTIRISDRMGRVVSVQSNVQKNSVIMVGNNLLNGTYFAEVLQGKHRQVVQLVKLK